MTTPFDAALAKLNNGQDVSILVVGDSTAWGSRDNEVTPLLGWPGRMGYALAAGLDVNAVGYLHAQLTPPSAGTTDLIGWYFYPKVTLHQSTNTAAPTITIYNAGWPGAGLLSYENAHGSFFPIANPDLIIIHTGFNDGGVDYTSAYRTLLANVQTLWCPGVPIVVTNENTTLNLVGSVWTFRTLFASLFVPGQTSGSMSPALQPATNFPGVWALDTLQCAIPAQDMFPSEAHPWDRGYSRIATWITSQLAPTVTPPPPMAAVQAKLLAGQSVTILALGDDTVYGAEDGGNLYGWTGRFALTLGNKYNASVSVYQFNSSTHTSYNAPVALHTGSSGATVKLYNGGWPGGTAADVATNSPIFPSVAVDLVFMQTGFNETAYYNFTGYAASNVSIIQSKYNAPPIIATTANSTTTTGLSGNPTFAQLFSALIAELLPGATLPLATPLQSSLVGFGLWVLDTQQAGLAGADLNSDGIYPTAAGYAKQAQWMYDALTSTGDSGVIAPHHASIATTMGTPGGIAPGKGGLVLPANWGPGDLFTAQDENNVVGELNAIVAAIDTLGPSLPPVPGTWAAGSIWTATDATSVAVAINSLNILVAALGGPSLSDVPTVASHWTAQNENRIEAAINALHGAVATLSGGG